MLEMSESVLTAMYSWFTPTVLFVFLNLMIGTIAISSSLASKSNDSNQAQIQRSPSLLHRLKSVNFSSFASPDKSNLEFPSHNHQHPSSSSATPDDDHSHQLQSIEQNQNQPFLSRSPSVLNRIKSFNLYNYISQESTSSLSVSEAPPAAVEAHQVTFHSELEEDDEADGDGGSSPSLEEVYSKLNLNHVPRTKSDMEPAAGVLPPKLPKKMKKSASTKSPFSHFEEEDVEARRPATARVPRVTTVEEESGAADEEVDAKADDFINRFKHQLKLQRIDSIAKYKDMVKKRSDQ